MGSIVDRLIAQLDALIPYLEMSRQDVFNLLNDNRSIWFSTNPEALPNAYAVYRKQVNHSAFLLGYSYFEHFLADLITNILRKRPSMLPSNKTVLYSEIIMSTDINEVIQKMIKRQVVELFLNGGMSEVIKELRNKYQFTIDKELGSDLCRASLIRNCIIHNSSKANDLLGRYEGFEENRDFEITVEEVHEYGIKIRSLARSMYREAEEKHEISSYHAR